MEMPREIMHHIHPSHPLTLLDSEKIFGSRICAVCEDYVFGLSYRLCILSILLTLSHPMWIHMGCADDVRNDKNEKEPLMKHPSHPQHELRFSKKTRWCPFPCNACGDVEKEDSYICTLCDYWIHESCALLPLSKDFPHHHHALSLAFCPPYEYIQYEFDCGICGTTLPLRRWVYHCHLCRYVVHPNCATSIFDDGNANGNAIDDGKEVTKFPIAKDDMYEEMIRPFVKRQKEQILIPQHSIGGKYSFSNHPNHLLTFTTFSASSSSFHDRFEKNDDDADDDEDDFDRWGLICDGCALPIREKKQTDDDDGYMSCDECKYFLHLSCFNLPLEIPFLPIHPLKDHNLRLQNDGKLHGWIICYICSGYTNALYYTCTHKGCGIKIDIKCASLPNTIKHASHPRHDYLKPVTGDDFRPGLCDNCHMPASYRKEQYRCNSCIFTVCGKCVMLSATIKHRLENHLLPLMPALTVLVISTAAAAKTKWTPLYS